MFRSINRRDFVSRAAQVGLLAGIGDFAFLEKLPLLAADDVGVRRNLVRLHSDIEPLVRLIEDTPRERLLAAAADRVRRGTSYQELMTAVMLAGVRGIQPRPVGFKFHAVLVINSAHLASMAAEDRDRWLPLFWALDNFKNSQERNRREGNWTMAPVVESRLPPATQARQRFIDAMDNWDEEAADSAIAALVRSSGASEVIEIFWRYGARDFRDIGHKAIYAANSWRALQTMGWRHAEPVMRSLAYALLEHEGGNPAQRDDERDRPYRENVRKIAQIRAGWRNGRLVPQATAEVLDALRTATPGEAADRVVALLNREVAPASIWDGLFLTAGELLMRQPGIVGLHCVTSINALHFAFQTSANDETRRLLMLQSAAFLTMFRQNMRGRGRLREDLRLDTLEHEPVRAQGPRAVEEIFADVSRDRLLAARKTLAWLDANPQNVHALLAAGRRLVFTKGNDSHDYKFSSAILEDFFHATPRWRNRFLATGMFHLRGSGGPDTDLLRRTRDALASL
jgi:hypothetical protein